MSDIINLGLVAILLVLMILVALLILKKLKRQIKVEKSDRQRIYLKAVKRIKGSTKTPSTKINELDKLSRRFFHEKFHLNPRLEYSEIISFFKKKNKRRISNYCDSFINIFYSGEKVGAKKIRNLISQFEQIIKEEKLR